MKATVSKGLQWGGEQPASLHPLIDALLETLPAPGSGWSAQARADWLAMIEMAFNVVYGRAERPKATLEELEALLKEPSTPVKVNADGSVEPLPEQSQHESAGCRFFVDAEGFARGPGGRRVTPEETDGMLYEYRRGTARDRSNVVWADGALGAHSGVEFCGPG